MNDKKRALLSLGIVLAISASSLYFWIVEISEYMKFDDAITFSWMSVSLISIPLVFTFPLYWFWLASRCGQEDAIKKISKVMPYFKYVCVLAIVLSVSLSLGYVTALKDKGYVACKGIPSGWTPGSATKYVVNEQLCHQ